MSSTYPPPGGDEPYDPNIKWPDEPAPETLDDPE